MSVVRDRDTIVDRFVAWTRFRLRSGADDVLERVGDETEQYELADGVHLTGSECAVDEPSVARIWQGLHAGIVLEEVCEMTGLATRWLWILRIHSDGAVTATGRRDDAGTELDGRDLDALARSWRRACHRVRERDTARARAERREWAEWLDRYGMTLGGDNDPDYARALGILDVAVGLHRVNLGDDGDAIRGSDWWYVPAGYIGCCGHLVFDNGEHAVLGSGLRARDWLWAQQAGLDVRSDRPWQIRASADLDRWAGVLPGYTASQSRRLLERRDPFSVRWMDLEALRTLVEDSGLTIEAVSS